MKLRAVLAAIEIAFSSPRNSAVSVSPTVTRSAEEEGLVSSATAARVGAVFSRFLRALSRGEG